MFVWWIDWLIEYSVSYLEKWLVQMDAHDDDTQGSTIHNDVGLNKWKIITLHLTSRRLILWHASKRVILCCITIPGTPFQPWWDLSSHLIWINQLDGTKCIWTVDALWKILTDYDSYDIVGTRSRYEVNNGKVLVKYGTLEDTILILLSSICTLTLAH